MTIHKRLSFLCFQLLSLIPLGGVIGCTGHPDEIRIKGSFEHIDQGEFYVYSSDEVLDHLDTLHVEEGSFSYVLPANQAATLHVLYPNFSELVVFARPGDDISIKGDAQNLNEVQVKGNEDNEVYTAFRLAVNGLGTKEAKAAARDCILGHPSLAVARHLFSSYYLQDKEADAKEAKEIYDSLCLACPEDLELSQLATAVRAIGKIRVGKRLPDFKLELRPGHGGNGDTLRTICRDDFKDKNLLFFFWASWKSGSQSAVYRARRTHREFKAKGTELSLISYSLDVNEKILSDTEKRDSIDYPSYCDFKSIQSPLVQQWGIRELPYFILVSPEGKILAAGTDWMKEIQPKASPDPSKGGEN